MGDDFLIADLSVILNSIQKDGVQLYQSLSFDFCNHMVCRAVLHPTFIYISYRSNPKKQQRGSSIGATTQIDGQAFMDHHLLALGHTRHWFCHLAIGSQPWLASLAVDVDQARICGGIDGLSPHHPSDVSCFAER